MNENIIIDEMIGKKFNKWLVLQRVENRNKKKYYLCKCDCGTIKEVCGSDLRNGKSKGCIYCRFPHQNITNKKFGKLIALYSTNEIDKNNGMIWMCKCDCGKNHKVPIRSLTSGSVQSCGCTRTEKIIKTNQERAYNLLGQKFGYLTVIDKADNQNKETRWLCRCQCGKEIKVTTKNLRNNKQISCGCITGSKGEKTIADILYNFNIKFETQKTFETCKFINTNRLAKFDFYLPQYNTLIEYDGIQHYKQGNGKYDNPEKFKITQQHDQYKNQWCKENHITLIRIPYTHLDNIELKDLLPQTSQFIV